MPIHTIHTIPHSWKYIPFNLDRLEVQEWHPGDWDKNMMGITEYDEQIEKYNLAKEKVLIFNTKLNYDSCDCGGGYGCSHGSWVYEITFTDQPDIEIEVEDDGLLFNTISGTISISHMRFTMADFVRFCELVGIQLQIKQ